MGNKNKEIIWINDACLFLNIINAVARLLLIIVSLAQ